MPRGLRWSGVIARWSSSSPKDMHQYLLVTSVDWVKINFSLKIFGNFNSSLVLENRDAYTSYITFLNLAQIVPSDWIFNTQWFDKNMYFWIRSMSSTSKGSFKNHVDKMRWVGGWSNVHDCPREVGRWSCKCPRGQNSKTIEKNPISIVRLTSSGLHF